MEILENTCVGDIFLPVASSQVVVETMGMFLISKGEYKIRAL